MGGPRFDESISFKGLRIAVMTVSDTRNEETDKSGAYLVERAQEAGHHVMDKVIIVDDRKRIEVQLRRWINEPNVEVVIATGGTGVTGRDVTPEAFEAVWEKSIPGFGELFRTLSYEHIGTAPIQSRACAGVARGTYLFALPGSTGACKDAWDGILRYQLDIRYRPCNFAEMMPRLQET
jgi:molybdenum cofactor biosynthesis protein B